MKKLFIVLAVALPALSFQSCKKCVECAKAGANTFEMCEADFQSAENEKKAYQAAISLNEANGYKCK